MKGVRSGWLAIGLGLITTLAMAQGTGPTVPDTPPAPLDSEQHRPEGTTRPSAPPGEDQTLKQENQQRPRSEWLPPEVSPNSTNPAASPDRRP